MVPPFCGELRCIVDVAVGTTNNHPHTYQSMHPCIQSMQPSIHPLNHPVALTLHASNHKQCMHPIHASNPCNHQSIHAPTHATVHPCIQTQTTIHPCMHEFIRFLLLRSKNHALGITIEPLSGALVLFRSCLKSSLPPALCCLPFGIAAKPCRFFSDTGSRIGHPLRTEAKCQTHPLRTEAAI